MSELMYRMISGEKAIWRNSALSQIRASTQWYTAWILLKYTINPERIYFFMFLAGGEKPRKFAGLWSTIL